MVCIAKCQIKVDDHCEKKATGFWHMKRICSYCFFVKNNPGESHKRKVYSKFKNGIFVVKK